MTSGRDSQRSSALSIRHFHLSVWFLARDAFDGMNRRAIVMMFVRLSVRLSGTGVHCDRTVHFIADLTLWLDSPMFWAPLHQSMSTYCQPSFSSSTWKRDWLGMDVQTRRGISRHILVDSTYFSRFLCGFWFHCCRFW